MSLKQSLKHHESSPDNIHTKYVNLRKNNENDSHFAMSVVRASMNVPFLKRQLEPTESEHESAWEDNLTRSRSVQVHRFKLL